MDVRSLGFGLLLARMLSGPAGRGDLTTAARLVMWRAVKEERQAFVAHVLRNWSSCTQSGAEVQEQLVRVKTGSPSFNPTCLRTGSPPAGFPDYRARQGTRHARRN